MVLLFLLSDIKEGQRRAQTEGQKAPSRERKHTQMRRTHHQHELKLREEKSSRRKEGETRMRGWRGGGKNSRAEMSPPPPKLMTSHPEDSADLRKVEQRLSQPGEAG